MTPSTPEIDPLPTRQTIGALLLTLGICALAAAAFLALGTADRSTPWLGIGLLIGLGSIVLLVGRVALRSRLDRSHDPLRPAQLDGWRERRAELDPPTERERFETLEGRRERAREHVRRSRWLPIPFVNRGWWRLRP